MTGRALYTLDTGGLEIEQISTSTKNFILSGNSVLWSNDEGLFRHQLVFRTNSKIDLPDDFRVSNLKEFGLNTSEAFVAVLDHNNRLLLYNTNLSTTTEVFEGVNSFSFSPNGSALAITQNNTDISVYYLTDKYLDDERFVDIYTIPNHVESMVWYKDNAHIFVRDTAGVLHFVEVDYEKPINAPVISSVVRSFQYDENDLIYYDNGEGIFSLNLK